MLPQPLLPRKTRSHLFAFSTPGTLTEVINEKLISAFVLLNFLFVPRSTIVQQNRRLTL